MKHCYVDEGAGKASRKLDFESEPLTYRGPLLLLVMGVELVVITAAICLTKNAFPAWYWEMPAIPEMVLLLFSMAWVLQLMWFWCW